MNEMLVAALKCADEAMENYEATLEQKRAHMAAIKIESSVVLTDFLAKLPADVTLKSVQIRTWWIPLGVNIYLEGITSWSQLTEALATLPGELTSSDEPESYTRIFETDTAPRYCVYAALAGDTDECRRVLVGHTDGYIDKPRPIYELRCGQAEPKAA